MYVEYLWTPSPAQPFQDRPWLGRYHYHCYRKEASFLPRTARKRSGFATVRDLLTARLLQLSISPMARQLHPCTTQHQPNARQLHPCTTQHQPNARQLHPCTTQHQPNARQLHPCTTQHQPNARQFHPCTTQHSPVPDNSITVQLSISPVSDKSIPVQLSISPVPDKSIPVHVYSSLSQMQIWAVNKHWALPPFSQIYSLPSDHSEAHKTQGFSLFFHPSILWYGLLLVTLHHAWNKEITVR